MARKGLFYRIGQEWQREVEKTEEARDQAAWNVLGRATAALEKMREAGMDENIIRLAEKRLFTSPTSRVGQAFRRFTGLSPYDAFQVDEVFASGQVESPKFVGWGYLPTEKLEQARAAAYLEAGEPAATAGARAARGRFEETRAREQEETLMYGGPKERGALLGTYSPMPALGREQFGLAGEQFGQRKKEAEQTWQIAQSRLGLERERVGISQQNVALAEQAAKLAEKNYNLALKQETRAEELHPLEVRAREARIAYLEALTNRAKTDPTLMDDPVKLASKFQDFIEAAIGKDVEFDKKGLRKIGIGATLRDKPEYRAGIETAFKALGLDRWYELKFTEVERESPWYKLWMGEDKMRIEIIPKARETESGAWAGRTGGGAEAEGAGAAPNAASEYLKQLGVQ